MIRATVKLMVGGIASAAVVAALSLTGSAECVGCYPQDCNCGPSQYCATHPNGTYDFVCGDCTVSCICPGYTSFHVLCQDGHPSSVNGTHKFCSGSQCS